MVSLPLSRSLSGGWGALSHPSGRGWASVGGLVSMVVIVALYAAVTRSDLRAIVDAGAPGWLLANAIGRTGGCFLAGCCFGVPTKSGWGVVFPPDLWAARTFSPGIAVWPTQLFYAALELGGFVLILWLERRHSSPGFTFVLVCSYYTLDRSLVGQLQYYKAPLLATLGPLRIDLNQPILWLVTVASIILWRTGRARARPAPTP